MATSLPPQSAHSHPPYWASASWPAQPAPPLLSLPHGPRPACFFLRMKLTERRRSLAPHPKGLHPLTLPKWPEHSPLITSHHRRIPSETAHNGAPLRRRLCSSPRPYKRHPGTPPASHHPYVLPLLFPPLLNSTAVTAITEPDAIGEMPLHRLPTHGDPAVELTGPSFPSPFPWPELSSTVAARGRAPVSSRAWQWPLVHGGLIAPWSTASWTESTDFSIQK
jgi:hypothetical protein